MPLNRVVAFAGPYISTGSGALASWLLVHAHFLSLFHFDGDKLAQGIAQVATFGIVTLVTWLGHSKWLDGHHAWAYGKGVAIAVPPRETSPPDLDVTPGAGDVKPPAGA